ncbi:MAG: T9SS type A sorting domain-containing protein [Ferruginibacter sp.]
MKSKIFFFTITLLWVIVLKAQPPNNSIFFGSAGDGFNRSANISLSNTIFLGGAGDGFTRAANISASNNIFTGGIGDGWNKAANTSASNSIFIGGAGDGWNKTANNSVSNTIFMGGTGDGWNKTANISVSNIIFVGGFGDGWNKAGNAAASNNIFLGGGGDGWARIYRPMGPLPVNFLYFNVRKQGKNIALLNWKTAQETNSSHYDVERSTDALNYRFIGKVTATGNTSTESSYSFTDNAPAKGFNYYRLKQVDRDGRFIYTASRVLNFDDMDAGQVKYYPNPTSGLLNVEITDAMKPEVKWITVSNTAGIVLDQVEIQPGNSLLIQLNFSKYPKGIYFIQLKTTCCNSTQRIVLQ